MKRCLLFICMLLQVGLIWATREDVQIDSTTLATISGYVVDRNTDTPIADAKVALSQTDREVRTNAEGVFILSHVRPGKYHINISALGYQNNTSHITVNKSDFIKLNIQLRPDAFQLNEAVVTGNCFAERHSHAATNVGVLTGATLEKVQATDIGQGLRFQPGIRVEDNCQNCGFSQVRINGLDGSYSQILIDSHPVYSSLAGIYGLEQIPANMIERVEVLRGGGSAIYGASAIAGTINIITKDPKKNSAMLSHDILGINGFHRFENVTRFNASLVDKNQKMGVALFGQKRHRSGYDHDDDGYTEMPQLDGSALGFRSFIRPTQTTRLSVEYGATHEFRRGGDMLDSEPHDSHITEQLDHTNQNGSFDFNFWSPNDQHKFNLYGAFMSIHRKSYYGGGDNTAKELIDVLDSDQPMTPEERQETVAELQNRMRSYGRTNGLTYITGSQYTYSINDMSFAPSFTIGLEYKHDNLDDKSGFRPAFIKQKVNTKGLFVQNEWRNDMFTILYGVRFDKHSLLDKAIISPRFNIRYKPIEGLTFRAGYSKGFRAPQIFDEDLHVDNAGGDLIISENSKDLKEEIAHSYTFSTDLYKCLGDWQFNIVLSGFYTQLKDAFAYDESEKTNKEGETYTQKLRVNSSGAKVMGGTLEAKVDYRNIFTLQGGWTMQSSRWDDARSWHDDDTYKTRRIFRSPDNYAYFVASYKPTHDLTFSINGNFTGSMLTGHEIPTEEDGTLTPYGKGTSADIHSDRLMNGPDQKATTYGPRTFETPTFFELGAKISYDFHLLGNDLQAYVGVKNVLNAYQDDFDRGPARDSAYIYGPMSPRSFFAGIKLSL